MKTGRTLPALTEELVRQADAKRDYVSPAPDLAVHSNGRTVLRIGDIIETEIKDLAHGQIAEYTGIPKTFYDRLRQQTDRLYVEPEVQALSLPDMQPVAFRLPLYDVTVNTLLRVRPTERRLVRTLDGYTRAFLSDTFNPDLDNWDVFRAALAVISRMGFTPEHIASADVTDTRLYIKVVSPKLQAEITPDMLANSHGWLKEPHPVQGSVIITSSEVGLGAVSVKSSVYFLRCTNMLITEQAYRQVHVGKALESGDDGMVYRDDTRQAEAAMRLLKIRDHIEAALNEDRFRNLVAKIQDTTAAKIEGDVPKVVEVTSKRLGLLESEKDLVIRHLIDGSDLSLYGLTNAVTRTAQDLGSYDRATELETMGGRLINMPKSEWKAIHAEANKN